MDDVISGPMQSLPSKEVHVHDTSENHGCYSLVHWQPLKIELSENDVIVLPHSDDERNPRCLRNSYCTTGSEACTPAEIHRNVYNGTRLIRKKKCLRHSRTNKSQFSVITGQNNFVVYRPHENIENIKKIW